MPSLKSLCVLVILLMQLVIPLQSHGMEAGFAPQPTVEIDGKVLRQLIDAESSDAIIALLMQEMEQKSYDQILKELATKLTIEDMESLYNILIHELRYEWTEELALKLWELRDQKIKLEFPPLYGHPRIISIAVSWNAAFWIVLSDGSIWNVDPSHMGGEDPSLQKIMINSLLGNYVIKNAGSGIGEYPLLFEVRDFPKALFGSYMNVRDAEGVNFEDKAVYYLGNGGFVK